MAWSWRWGLTRASPSGEGLAARQGALRLLDAVLRRGQTLEAAAQALGPDGKSLALAIAGEALRRLPDLDALIDGATRTRMADDAKARAVLRLALAQKVALQVPDHAIVATTLPLVAGGPRRLVHGVLGTLLRRGVPAAREARLPPAVEERWRTAWGNDVVAGARRSIVRRPPLDLTFATAEAAAAFAAETGGLSLAERHVRLRGGAAVTELPDYDRGEWWIQDLAASLPARLMPAAPARVLDLCAAPGGKTMQLAAAGHSVTAVDRSDSRLRRLSANLTRTGLGATLVARDALDWSGGPFDAILLDAPCSATGTFRRHPEVLYRARPSIIAEGAELQKRLLTHAATLLRPGGTLVYAVCSLEPEEGEQVVVDHAGLQLDRIGPDELPPAIVPHPSGWVRVLPGVLEEEGGADGFFIARLVRRGA